MDLHRPPPLAASLSLPLAACVRACVLVLVCWCAGVLVWRVAASARERQRKTANALFRSPLACSALASPALPPQSPLYTRLPVAYRLASPLLSIHLNRRNQPRPIPLSTTLSYSPCLPLPRPPPLSSLPSRRSPPPPLPSRRLPLPSSRLPPSLLRPPPSSRRPLLLPRPYVTPLSIHSAFFSQH